MLKLDESSQQAPQRRLLAAAFEAGQRKTFLGVTLDTGHGGVLAHTTRLSDVTVEMRPNQPGDPGYAQLLEALWAEIEEPDRGVAKRQLFDSTRFKSARNVSNIESQLVLLGQDSFNRVWRRNTLPKLNLLGDFLETVWRPIWAETPL